SITHQVAYVERVSDERAASDGAVVTRDVLLDVTQVLLGSIEHRSRNVETFFLGAMERVGDMDAHVRPRLIVSTPEAEAAIVALERLQPLDVTRYGVDHLFRLGKS